MILRQLMDRDTATYTYLVADPVSRKAALIDPVLEQVERDLTLVEELGLTLTHVFETHVHADHITGAAMLRRRTGAVVVGSRLGAPCADIHTEHGDVIPVGALQVRVLATPGHTPESQSYLVLDKVFTGDALLVRDNGRTDFQHGDAGVLFDSVQGVLFLLPPDTAVFPGHDMSGICCSTIAEEKRFNAIARTSRDGFVAIMAGLHLEKPARMDLAVPANLQCGHPRPA